MTVLGGDRTVLMRAPRSYIGARPSYGPYGEHWPTDDEYEAIHAAVAIGKQKGRCKQWCVEVRIRNSPHVARVTYYSPENAYHTQITQRSNPANAGCLNEKSWMGLPVWADQVEPRKGRHTYQDTGLFHGPGDCCDGCRQQVDAHHRTVIHHHRNPARHIHHDHRAQSSALGRALAVFGFGGR